MKYYKTDSRKISFREYWHITPKGFWLAWWNKIRGVQMNTIRGIPEPQPFKSRIVEPGGIPGQILAKLNSVKVELQKLGFEQFWYYSNTQSLSDSGGYAIMALHSARQVTAKVLYVFYHNRERMVVVFNSSFTDGTTVGSTNKKKEFNPLPELVVVRKVGCDAACLLKLHQDKVAQLCQTKTPVTLAGLDDVSVFEDKLIQEVYDDKIRRGIWVEMTEPEIAALRAQPPKVYVRIPPAKM